MFREVAVCALALSGHLAAVEAFKLENRDGIAAHGHHDHHAHDHAHEAASSGGAVAATGYAAPATGYDEPATGYGAVSHSGYGATEPALPDLTPIIIAILVLTGLSLLFPTYVSLSAGRRKRDLDGIEESSPMTDVLDRVNDIYMAVVESEECMERIACEIGGLAADFGMKDNAIAKMADPLVPAKYKTYYKQFTSGQDCQKIKCGNFNF
jgi:hypothetical protein